MHIVVLLAVLLPVIVVPGVRTVMSHPDRRAADNRARRNRDAYRHLAADCSVWVRPPWPDPCIEYVAAELRRLSRERTSGLCAESVRWQAAVQLAYDNNLQMASEALGVSHQLAVLDGMDRDLERLRVEEELKAAGLKLR
ncbi:hypothetical protein GCM10010435_43680 [Winogradskya consettensis]|uniref:Uncharacterized protein n=1 Tax=Winogradskya consettensis TaxID=113560 RepID=A0A919T2K7_9ACTN|nr:hypothetical protein [Actinoplanes consettensis]GIM82550.1 hypothetical protein Aco04nite_82070 [Actinoplanes consettensis]